MAGLRTFIIVAVIALVIAAYSSLFIVDQRQADSGALHRPPPGAAYAIEAFEDMRQIVGADADAGIAHDQLHVVFDRLQAHGDAAALGIFQRIRKQVADDLFERVAVERPAERRGRLHVEHDPLPARGGRKRLRKAAHKRCEVQIAYAIGVARPVGVHVKTFGTGKVSDEKLEKYILEHFDIGDDRGADAIRDN